MSGSMETVSAMENRELSLSETITDLSVLLQTRLPEVSLPSCSRPMRLVEAVSTICKTEHVALYSHHRVVAWTSAW